jgi:peptide/nickel transport system permease protein
VEGVNYLLRRLAFYLVAAWVAVTANFFIPRAVPGNAVQAIMSKFPGQLTPAAYNAIASMLGVGKDQGSLWHQYVTYLGNCVHFNFGISLSQFPTPASAVVGAAIPYTLLLVGVATIIAFFLGTGLGILAGWRAGGRLDRSLPGLMFIQAIPYFFLALLVIEVFALTFTWFPPAGGYDGQNYSPGWNWPFISSALDHAILPAFTIVVTSVAGWMLQMRNVMVTTVGEDYVVAAQAKGLSDRRVILTYAARNALLPQLQGFGLALGFVVSGALVMEIVFSYPGIGLLLVNAVQGSDYPLMQAIFLVITFAVLIANLIIDLVLVLFDPRVRAREAAR